MQRYYSLAAYFRQRFARRVRKIPLDAGADCPNRDGRISTTGCIFCNPSGSGTGLGGRGLSLRQQWDLWRARMARPGQPGLYLAYLQSFSNTYGPLERLRSTLDQLAGLPELAGLAVGTRPDCLDPDKLALLAAQPVDELWLELGLQSASDETLSRINRGHNLAAFQAAVRAAAGAGLKVCAHVIAGLPGETGRHLLDTVDALNALPVHGVKFHNLYVCRGSTLAAWWEQGDYEPISRDEYADWMSRALARLRPDVVVQRLAADPAPGELLAPAWAADKPGLLAAIRDRLERDDIRQGQDWDNGAPHGRAE